ncbi:MAG: hypothetical protein PVH18_02620 [Chloroflexota bacterium]|jgi:hypothetical protein
MRKLALSFSVIVLLVVMVACASGSEDESTVNPQEDQTSVTPSVTLSVPTKEVPGSGPTAYPAFATATPAVSGDGYPISTPSLPDNPYPGGLATIVRPKGLQCEEAVFPDLSAAIRSLEEAGIVVVAAEAIGLEVCEACDCPTSEHFQVQIYAYDLDRALDMGWQRRTLQ